MVVTCSPGDRERDARFRSALERAFREGIEHRPAPRSEAEIACVVKIIKQFRALSSRFVFDYRTFPPATSRRKGQSQRYSAMLAPPQRRAADRRRRAALELLAGG